VYFYNSKKWNEILELIVAVG